MQLCGIFDFEGFGGDGTGGGNSMGNPCDAPFSSITLFVKILVCMYKFPAKILGTYHLTLPYLIPISMHNYDTVSEAVNGLKQRGYNIDFNLEKESIVCPKTPLALMPYEFEITEVYRFEGNTDPADEAIVYAIESVYGQKGILVNGFGPSADSTSAEMVQKLAMHHGEARM